MMTIGVCVSLSRKPVAECFESITKMGFHHCQLMSGNRSLRTPEKAEEIKAACKKYEVTVTALWCGWSGLDRVELLRRAGNARACAARLSLCADALT